MAYKIKNKKSKKKKEKELTDWDLWRGSLA
jgi:hypothetical protein